MTREGGDSPLRMPGYPNVGGLVVPSVKRDSSRLDVRSCELQASAQAPPRQEEWEGGQGKKSLRPPGGCHITTISSTGAVMARTPPGGRQETLRAGRAPGPSHTQLARRTSAWLPPESRWQ